jgi:hypothetical protein
VRGLMLIVLTVMVGALIWGCVEELEQAGNQPPRVWFTTAPEDNSIIFQNAATFEWIATDWDDDLGMGATYVRLDTLNTPVGPWERVYENIYEVIDLPDTNYSFKVRVVDGRGADSTISRDFIVRFDNVVPVIDSIICPAVKQKPSVFNWIYKIYAHDEALNARAATPSDSLEFWYRFVGPPGVETEESDPEWSMENSIFEVTIDGLSHEGTYTFRCKARDRAMNTSPELKCQFKVEK